MDKRFIQNRRHLKQARLTLLAATLFLLFHANAKGVNDNTDVRTLDEVQIISSFNSGLLDKVELPAVSTIKQLQIERRRVESIKELSSLIPNYYMPDYGSRMTSTVYIRGLGTRTDNSVVGLYVDGIPYFNKNSFDFDFYDIRSVTVLSGPQSTLFGRNTMGGVLDINTLSPLFFQGSRSRLEYGNGNSMNLSGSLYRLTKDSVGWSVSGYLRHSDGLYTNSYNGEKCDFSNSMGLRSRIQKIMTPHLSLDNTITFNLLSQGGFPYAPVDENGVTKQVSYNDECGYKRLFFSEGLSVKHLTDKHSVTNVTSYQYLDDAMRMDQDFMPQPFFTMEQIQREHLISNETVIKPSLSGNRWNWVSGLMWFGRSNSMDAPVTFKRDGINELILANANKGLNQIMPGAAVLFEEEQFIITDEFHTRSIGAAVYHNSTFSTESGLKFEAGIRLDLEGSWFDYYCNSSIHYELSYASDRQRLLETELRGTAQQFNLELLPRLSLSYERDGWNVFMKVTKGYKAGGYNTQLFSDILKSAMQENLMHDIGVTLVDAQYSSVRDVVEYKPEYSWNYEIGGSYSSGNFSAQATAFYINCMDRQLTVFPKGKNTGRMMTNAGSSRSVGAEASIAYHGDKLTLYTNWGYTYADFRKYVSGDSDYRGKMVPYVPRHTVSAGGDYTIHSNGAFIVDYMILHLLWRGVGPIYWDEENSHIQTFYGLGDCSIAFCKKNISIELWSKNVTDTKYNVFSFVSMGNRFAQRGKPRQCGISIKYDF